MDQEWIIPVKLTWQTCKAIGKQHSEEIDWERGTMEERSGFTFLHQGSTLLLEVSKVLPS
jgi:hypothetical protein